MGDDNVVQFEAARARELAQSRFIEVVKVLDAKWLNVLNGNEFKVFWFINSRTYRYGKPSEIIPARHFIEGVTSAEGNVLHSGLGISRDTLFRALGRLRELGLIRVGTHLCQSGAECNTYAIDFKTLQKGPDVSKLKVSKKRRGASPKIGLPPSDKQTRVVRKSDARTTDIKQQNRNNRNMAGEPARLEDAIASAEDRNRDKRKTKAKSTRLSMNSVKALFTELMLESYPGVQIAPMTKVEYGIFKKQYESIINAAPYTDVLKWVVSNWDDIVTRDDYKWIRTKFKAEVPSPGVVARLYRYFAEAYSQHDQWEESHLFSRRKKQERVVVRDERKEQSLQRQVEDLRKQLKTADKANIALEQELKKRNEGDLQDFGEIEWEGLEDEG